LHALLDSFNNLIPEVQKKDLPLSPHVHPEGNHMLRSSEGQVQ